MNAMEPTTQKKPPQYFEPTKIQLAGLILLFAIALIASWELPRLPIFS
jgi:hypothetical protein